MDQDELNFARVVFAGLLSIQFHPRNDVSVDAEPDVINRCLGITAVAVHMFSQRFHPEEG